MASFTGGSLLSANNSVLRQFVRYRWYKKIRVNLHPSLKHRLDELDETKNDPELYSSVNIGFSAPKKSRKEHLFEHINKVKKFKQEKQNLELEKLAKKRLLKVDLDGVQEDWENSTISPTQIQNLADHYGIFKDLFGLAHFTPLVYLNIAYDYDDEFISLVYRGNTLKPKETSVQPSVRFSSKPDDLWTLILTNPDGNLYDNDAECLHWFVGNIPGGDVSKGQVICDYLQPFPPRGTGYHRHVFLLYKQEGPIDFSKFQKQSPCLQLRERTFSTLDFYREHQDVITPAGLSWFQSDWDSSLTDFFHQTLDMKEPVFEYDFPEPYHKPQEHFPLKRLFFFYMDMHRDPKELNKEVLLERLKKINPLEKEPPVSPFPMAIPIDIKHTSWERREIKKARLGVGKYRDLFRGRNRPPQVMDEFKRRAKESE